MRKSHACLLVCALPAVMLLARDDKDKTHDDKGHVVVMPQAEYQAWLGGAAAEGTLAQRGEKLFTQFACITCHRSDSQGRGPVLNGLLGSTVHFGDGSTLTLLDAGVDNLAAP